MRLAAICALLLSACTLSGCHHGGGPRHGELTDILVVVGSGEVKTRPDIVRLTLGVESQGTDVTAAVAGMTARMRAVIDALKASGVADKDVQTSQFSIYSEQPPYPPPYPLPSAEPAAEARPMGKPGAPPPVAPPAPPARPPTTYRVTNNVSVVVRQIDQVGAVLGAALAAGANQAGGIQFALDDRKPFEDQARAKAMEDARHRAAELARLSQVKLGRVLNVTEGGGAEPVPMMAYSMKMAERTSSEVPTEEGQVVVSHDVRVVYRIDQE